MEKVMEVYHRKLLLIKMFIRKACKYICTINLKTVIFNFHYFPIKTAIKLPVYIALNVDIVCMKGRVLLENDDGCFHTGSILIGAKRLSILDKKTRSVWSVAGVVRFRGTADFGQGIRIAVDEAAKLEFGENFSCRGVAVIAAKKSISFGNDCMMSWDTLVMDSDHHDICTDSGTILNADQEIVIANKVWIGCRSAVYKGTIIPEGTIVGADTYVSGDYSEKGDIIVLNAGTKAKKVPGGLKWIK